jgi:hypothetical protein
MMYEHQLDDLCKQEQYEEAGGVKLLLEKEVAQHSRKQYYEWKNYRDKQVRTLSIKQGKEREVLRGRLESLLR